MKGTITENSPTSATYADVHDNDWTLSASSILGPWVAKPADPNNVYKLPTSAIVGAATARADLVESLDNWIDQNFDALLSGQHVPAFAATSVTAKAGGLGWLVLLALIALVMSEKKGR